MDEVIHEFDETIFQFFEKKAPTLPAGGGGGGKKFADAIEWTMKKQEPPLKIKRCYNNQ